MYLYFVEASKLYNSEVIVYRANLFFFSDFSDFHSQTQTVPLQIFPQLKGFISHSMIMTKNLSLR
jgi:hypothetical protein